MRFRSREEAVRSILMLNNANIKGNRIQVCLAKYEKKRGKGKDKESREGGHKVNLPRKSGRRKCNYKRIREQPKR